MQIKYAKQAVKAINAMDRADKQRIKTAIEKLPNGDIKPLRGCDGVFRLRVGKWRILFSNLTYDIIMIEKVAPRGEVYKGV